MDRISSRRMFLLRAVAVLAFALLAVRLWELQIVSTADYVESADRNRFRLVPVDAPRGIIYDRFGRILVRNVPSFAVNVVPAGLPDDPAERTIVLERVGELLRMPVELPLESDPLMAEVLQPSIERILAERTISPYAPVRLASNVDRQAAFIIEEEHLQLPGVTVQVEPLRQYEYGPLMSHLLGYVGSIPSERMVSYEDLGYAPGDQVGLTGIEFTQQEHLRGIKGQKHIEVDAFEREVSVIASEPPQQGDNVILTIDLDLQNVVEQALRKGMNKSGAQVGVAIAMDPATGEVLSLVSLPSYDNNLFSGGISYKDYAALSSDKNHPMVNHAISGQYPPGSTFKIVPASAALQEGVIDRSTTFTCRGTMVLPSKLAPDDPTQGQTFYCWYDRGHGPLNVVGALLQSCDVFFYQAAGGFGEFEGLGIERLTEYASAYGFGEPSGIALAGEASGLLPSDRWKRQVYSESWYTGDTYNAAIGQGFVLATPLQVLNATVAVANGGTVFEPQLVFQVSDAEGNVSFGISPKPIRHLDISQENMDLVREGMLEAVRIGTAWYARIPGLSVAGKTGTAEYPGLDEEGNLALDEEGNLPTHAWFTAFAPYEEPEIALVVFLEGGGEGSQMAVPVAAEILRYYFDVPAQTLTQSGDAIAD